MELGPKLAFGERGAIIMRPSGMEGGPGVLNVGDIHEYDPDLLRCSILMFDRLDSPANSFFQLGAAEPEGLEDWSGFQRTHVSVEGTIGGELEEVVLIAAFNALNDREDGLWTIARSAQSIEFPEDALGPRTAFKLKLENALPMPDRSVPLDEVLNYKHRRRDELQNLRHHIEGIVLDVARDGFGGLAEHVALEKFMKPLEDHHKAIGEANFMKRLTGLELTFDWREFSGLVYEKMALAPFALTTTFEVFATAALASIGIEQAFSLKRFRKAKTPFEYIFKAGVEM